MTDPDCVRFSELAPELALGSLDGRERAESLAHLRDCERCREELRRYNELSDGLLDLIPTAEPPAGFESRVLAAVTSAAARPSAARSGDRALGRRGRWAGVAAAVALALGLVGYSVGHRGGSDEHLRRATLTSAGRPVGAAYYYGGKHPWVYMGVTSGSVDRVVTCELWAHGRPALTAIGTFTLVAGHGSWGAEAPPSLTDVTGARLVDATGATVAEGSFKP